MNQRVFRAGSILVSMLSILFLFAVSARAESDGASVYKAKCAMCHAADGSGNSPTGKSMKVPDLRSADVQKKTDAQLIEATANGMGKMPAYKGKLTDDQIKQVVVYIRDLAKKK